MPLFVYRAKKGPKEIVEGEIDAENEESALGKIADLGLIPIKIEAAVSGVQRPSDSGSRAEPPRKERSPVSPTSPDAFLRIRHKDFNVFTRQFAILLKANVPLLKIFDTLQGQTVSTKFKAVLKNIQEQIRQGASLSEVLSRYPGIFTNLYISMVEAGEVSGTLDIVLTRLADFTDREAEIRSKIQSAMIYPLFLLGVGILTVFILLTFIMPRLMTVFKDLGTELPTVTQVVIQASQFCQSYWLILLIAGFAGGLILRTQAAAIRRNILDGLLIKLPVVKDLVGKAEIAKFLRSLELLYENGITLYRAVEVSTRTLDNHLIRKEFQKIPERLEAGSTLAKSMEGIPYVTEFVINMVSVGEESGSLGSAVRETAGFYEQETNQVIKIATTLIEPFMILLIGTVVGFLIIAMLLPIFEIHVLAQ